MSEFYCDDKLWNKCMRITVLLNKENFTEARKMLKETAENLKANNMKLNPLLNSLLHCASMYSYIDEDTADFDDAIAKEFWRMGKLIEADV